MDIGEKLKVARIAANLTQDQASEAIGVSRQTISNWENEKTYPDIISVIKMSDLYCISLDRLLKEEKAMPDYIDYLGESTDTVKSHKKLSATVLAAVYLAVWAFSLLVFWCFIGGSDALGYSLMFIWILIPILTFAVYFIIAKNNYYEKRKWLLPIVFGIMHMLAEYATFNMANMISFSKINLPNFELILIGSIVSFAGIGLGTLFNIIKSKIK
ncbi:MAG: helix-turn-helix domain-containing protein [Oscillospiraceae bacterium]|nr:helix-turn-helix domain-containing protein [Oscillospiraceae bacterium]